MVRSRGGSPSKSRRKRPENEKAILVNNTGPLGGGRGVAGMNLRRASGAGTRAGRNTVAVKKVRSPTPTGKRSGPISGAQVLHR